MQALLLYLWHKALGISL